MSFVRFIWPELNDKIFELLQKRCSRYEIYIEAINLEKGFVHCLVGFDIKCNGISLKYNKDAVYNIDDKIIENVKLVFDWFSRTRLWSENIFWRNLNVICGNGGEGNHLSFRDDNAIKCLI